jgi:hypothetical protein
MNHTKSAWHGDWAARIQRRMHEIGCETIADYLARCPGETYISAARGLGDDIAPVQLAHLQLQEAKEQGHLRLAAMDSLTREINESLVNGWGCSDRSAYQGATPLPKDIGRSFQAEEDRHIQFLTDNVYVSWILPLKRCDESVFR